jgi:hypothetical protein
VGDSATLQRNFSRDTGFYTKVFERGESSMRKSHILGFVLLAMVMVFMPARSSAQISVGVAVHIGPPALPVYEQPICPGAGYLWTPGYWAYGPDGYYWVPGTWVMAPEAGFLWTPGYWGWGGGGYFWHAGHWGPHVGFYGGINYGFGYGGVGFVGGRWNHGVFAYNTAVMHVNTTVIHNTYVDRTVINNVTVNHVSYNGGAGGVTARATHEELSAEHERHIAPTSVQTQHEHSASTNRAFLASENHGRPAVAATARPGEFTGHGVVAAKTGSYHASLNGASNSNHPNNSANVKTDRPPSAQAGNKGNTSFNTSHPNNSAGNTNHPNTSAVNGNHPNSGAPNTSHRNNASNPPKNQTHTESKPPKENKPHEGGEKPHKS